MRLTLLVRVQILELEVTELVESLKLVLRITWEQVLIKFEAMLQSLVVRFDFVITVRVPKLAIKLVLVLRLVEQCDHWFDCQ